MKPYKFFTLALLASFDVLAGEPKEMHVAAVGGLFLRSEPSVSGKTLILMPRGSAVSVAGETEHFATIDGISSRWVSAKYKNITGFAFGGYLVSLPVPTSDCQLLQDYWRNTLGVKTMRTYYQIAEKNGSDVYTLNSREYDSEPAIDYQRQMLVLQRFSANKDGSTFVSSVVNGAGTDTLHLTNTTVREAYLIMALCLPKESTPKLKPFSEFIATGKQCFFTRDAVYLFGITQIGSASDIVVSGALGNWLNDCHP